MVDINKVLEIQLNISESSVVTGNYDTTIYVIPNLATPILLTKASEALGLITTGVNTITATSAEYSNISMYFDNKGKYLYLIGYNSINSSAFSAPAFISAIQDIRYEDAMDGHNFIYVNIANAILAATAAPGKISAANLTSLATAVEAIAAPNQFRLGVATTVIAPTGGLALSAIIAACEDCSVAVSCASTDTTTNILDTSLLIGALYSTVVIRNGEITDYAYTKVVNVPAITYGSYTYDTLISANVNFVDRIGNHMVVFGGDLINNNSIDVDFFTVSLANALSQTLLNVLLSKIKMNAAGQGMILGAVQAQLSSFANSGIINAGATYLGNDITYTYGSNTYNILKSGTTLTNGYTIFAVPLTDIIATDATKRRLTPIVVVVLTSKGVRIIKLSGEIN